MSTHKSAPGLFERKPYLLAIILSVLLVTWMASGSSEALTDAEEEEVKQLPRVEVTTYEASNISRSIELYGRTEPERALKLSSEVEGRVARLLADEGQLVKQGQAIIELAFDDKKEQVEYAKALVEQREIEYKGAKSLNDKGLQGQSLLAKANAALISAKATLRQREIALEKSVIRAPFDGVLDMRQIEVGSFVRKGDVLFDLVDLNPLIVNANVTEVHIDKLDANTLVEVQLVDGSIVPGRVRYIASVSAKGTNTFPIEIEIDNPDQSMKAGVSTELNLKFDSEQAIKVTPALLSLDAAGNLGVKTVVDEVVVFNPIDMIKADKDGVWLGGFSGKTDVITLGQGFVRPGDKVRVSYKQL